jgi:transposase
MIVVGVDVHKHSLSAVAIDELGRTVAAHAGPVDESVLEWARSFAEERLWALEDCRHVTRGLERALLTAGERLVRVPPRLTAPQRRRSRTRGKSDGIDALAIARAALQEPQLDGPRAGEEKLHELKLLVDHRDDLVDERRRCQQRLRWHLHELEPRLQVPLGALDRPLWLDRVARQLARREQTTQVRIGRDLVGRCRTLTRSIAALDRELQTRTASIAPRLLQLPGCGPLSAAKLLCEIGPIERFRGDAQLARHAGVAPLDASFRQTPTAPARPRRQPTTQLRPAPDRDHPRPRPPAGTRLSRAQAKRGQEPPRSDPLPQATARPHRLQHAESRVSIDIDDM